jgi:DNA-binding MarR family transcriptional regulator
MRKIKKTGLPHLPRPGEGKRGTDGHIGYLLRQAGAAFRGQMDRALAELGITAPQFVVLTMISSYPGVSNAEVGRMSHLTPQTVNIIVDNLKRSGAIASQPHVTHGRIKQLTLTVVGREILSRSKPRVQVLEKQLLAGLTGAEEGLVRRWLVQVARSLAE